MNTENAKDRARRKMALGPLNLISQELSLQAFSLPSELTADDFIVVKVHSALGSTVSCDWNDSLNLSH